MGMEAIKLKLTNNRKVRFKKNHYNTFSLRQGHPKSGGTCPGMTKGEGGCEEVCYDKTLRRIYTSYAAVEDYNTELLRGKRQKEIFNILDNTIVFWKKEHAKNSLYFRIHTGGDFFNKRYAAAWKDVIDKNNDVYFWAYTRSLFAVPILESCENLTLYLSCDPVNLDEALTVYEQYKHKKNIAIAWMGNEVPLNFPEDRFTLVCPEVSKKLKNTEDQGACSRCKSCINRYPKNNKIRHIKFNIHR
jgi:hypothetical protein